MILVRESPVLNIRGLFWPEDITICLLLGMIFSSGIVRTLSILCIDTTRLLRITVGPNWPISSPARPMLSVLSRFIMWLVLCMVDILGAAMMTVLPVGVTVPRKFSLTFVG